MPTILPLRSLATASLALALALLGTSRAAANFEELAEPASNVPGDLERFGAAFFRDCDSASNRRGCERQRRRDQRTLTSVPWLLETGAEGFVEIDPYDAERGGYTLRIRTFYVEGIDGVLSAERIDAARPPETAYFQRFVSIPPERAEAFARRHSLDRLRFRFVFRFQGSPFRAGERPAIRVRPLGAQVYNLGTGDFLLDTTRMESEEDADARRMLPRGEQVQLWAPDADPAAVRWRTRDEVVALQVQTERMSLQGGERTLVKLFETRGATPRQVGSFVAPCCSANLSAFSLGRERLVVIFTERAQTELTAGYGTLHLYTLDPAQGLVRAATWEGDTNQTPPAWLADPDAELPAAGVERRGRSSTESTENAPPEE